jgi:hypothetical protein
MDYFSIIDNILTNNINNYLYVENLYESFIKELEKSKIKKNYENIYSEYIPEYIFLLHVATYYNNDYNLKIIKGTSNIVYIGLFEFDYEEENENKEDINEEETENIHYERTEDESIESENSDIDESTNELDDESTNESIDESENNDSDYIHSDEEIDDDSEYIPSENESDEDDDEEDILISKISIIQLIKYIINTENTKLIDLLLNYNDNNTNTNILHIIIENNMFNELDKILIFNNLDLLNQKDLYNHYPIDYASDKSLRIILNKSLIMNMNLNNNIERLNKEKNCLKNDVHLFYILINFGAFMFSFYYLLYDDTYKYIKYMY